MRDSDRRELLSVMRRAVEAAGGRKHDVEAAMGLSHGRLEHLWSGKLELRVRHLVGLAEFLGVPPSDFLATGCPHAQAAPRRLAEWIGPAEPPFAATRSAPETATAPVADEECLRRLLREELAALRAGDASKAP
jgi:transcriptional regulator with XRE-family HTH domain